MHLFRSGLFPHPVRAVRVPLLALLLACALLPALARPGRCAASTPVPSRPDILPDAGLDTMIGQLLFVGFRGTAAPPDSPVIRDLAEVGVGGIILFDYDVRLREPGRNITGPEQLRKLAASLRGAARVAPFIAVDQEGGAVRRLRPRDGFPDTPSAAGIGALADAGNEKNALCAAHEAGEITGRTLAEVGINLNFAPVADVNANPDNPVIGRLGRSFSADPLTVARLCRAFIEGQRESGVLSCIKHFPGHGSSRTDSHLGVTDVTETWSRDELVPFRRLIADHDADMVMTGHLFNAALDPDHPATLSRPTLTGLLRDELGYDGVVVTDDLQMKAVADRYGLRETLRLALLAGADMLLFGNNLAYDPDIALKAHAAIRSLVLEGEVPEARVRQAYERVLRLKQALKRP